MEPNPYRERTAIYRPRTGEGFRLREGVEAFAGDTLSVSLAWDFEDTDRGGQYKGEAAYYVTEPEALSRLVGGWIASGDLEFTDDPAGLCKKGS
jgi:hypothetical protein